MQEPPYEEAVFDTKVCTTRQPASISSSGRRSIFEFGPAVQTWLLSEQGELVKGVRAVAASVPGRPDAGVRRDGSALIVWPQEVLWSDEDGPLPTPTGIRGQWISPAGELREASFAVSSNVGTRGSR
jgi:hypothetical protein